jgi:nuclear transport factor 2 (NTF2) superfamily protein
MTAATLEIADVSVSDAKAMLARAEELFSAGAVDQIVAGYTPDVRVRFADVPEIRGRENFAAFLKARFARQRNYKLRKEFRAVYGPIVGSCWEGTWQDAKTGKQMQGRGVEFSHFRGDLIELWEATFNVWEVGGASTLPIT